MKNKKVVSKLSKISTQKLCEIPFIYLDNASTTFPKPECVYDFMNSFYRRYGVNPGRSKGYAYQQAENVLNGTRERLTRMFNGSDPKRLIFTYNATDSLNMIINGILRYGDHVVTTTIEHNSVLRPLNHLARDRKIKVSFVSFDKDGFVNPEDIKKKIRKKTKLVIVNHGSNVLGTIQPITEIGALCHKKGVVFAIDASQTAGVIPIDIKKMHIDVVAFTGHKSLLGPMGIGGFYVRQGVDIKPTRFGGTGILGQDKFQPREFPYYLECGTVNMVGVAGLYSSVNYLNQKGVDDIYRHEIELARLLYDGLRKIDEVILYARPSINSHLGVFSFNIRGRESSEVGNILDTKYHICSRPGLHCAPLVHEQIGTIPNGTVRLSMGPFNTKTEINVVIQAVAEIAAGN